MKRYEATHSEEISRILRNVHKDLAALLRVAHEQHFVVRRTKGGHMSITSPEHWRERETVFAPSTPSDTRGIHRVAAKLRRIGVQVPH